MFGKILEKATYIKAKIKKDQLEIALAQATTQDNWQASTTVLHQISSSAYDHQKWRRISDFLWERLKNRKNWKKILKCLNIVEFLLKNGPQFACGELRMETRFFKTMESFQELQGTFDRGASIRKVAKSIVQLLQDHQFLQDQRLRAHQIRQKMSRMTGGSIKESSTGRPSSYVPKYESYNSDTFNRSQDNKGYYNYGHGLYGDRYEDKKFDHDYFGNAQRFKEEEKSQKQRPKSSVTVPDNQPPQMKPEAIRVNNNLTNNASIPNKFSSITQSLMKKKKKPQEEKPQGQEVFKPDLSYKKKQPQLIDLEEAFMDTRYHFEQTPTSQSSSQKAPANKTVNQQTQPSSQPLLLNQTTSRPQNIQKLLPQSQQSTIQTKQQVLSENQAISFLGAPTHQTASNNYQPPSQTHPSPPQIPQNPSQIPQSPQIPQNYSQITQNPPQIPQIDKNTSLPSFNQMAANTAPFPIGYNSQPYGMPATYNQFNTYNSFGPSYYNHSQSQQPFAPTYSTNPVYPPQQTYPISNNISYLQQGSYPNAGVSQIGLGNVTYSVKQQKKEEKGGEKQMGGLMDLSDIMQQIEENKRNTPSKGNKQEVTNGVKIDPWAW